MNFYFEPINNKKWNLFEHLTHKGREEEFLATKTMKQGDYIFLYIGDQDKKIKPGVYAIAKVTSNPYIYTKSKDQYCYNKLSVDTVIISLSHTEPILSKKEIKSINSQFRTKHMFDKKNYDYLKDILSNQTNKRRVLFCNIAYMKFYDDRIKDDIPKNGGEYVRKHSDALEKNNFKECNDGYYRGWVETKHKKGYELGNLTNTFNELHIEKIDSGYKNKEKIENVLVVFCAKKEGVGTVIVGWYKNATVYRNRPTYNGRLFNIITDKENVYLIPHENRNFEVSRARQDVFGFGQSNIRFADFQKFGSQINEILEFIEKYSSDNTIKIIEDEYQEDYIESGKGKKVFTTTYERNTKARRACLSKYGTKCQICGFDSQKIYGEDFKEKIHVHHIVPIHEIENEYKVDPEKDLIPVCPNCHMILHSKKPNGKYPTVNEIKTNLLGHKHKKKV